MKGTKLKTGIPLPRVSREFLKSLVTSFRFGMVALATVLALGCNVFQDRLDLANRAIGFDMHGLIGTPRCDPNLPPIRRKPPRGIAPQKPRTTKNRDQF